MAPIISERPSFTDEEALAFHNGDKPGKLEIRATKPMATQRDLSLAYSPGVAVPVRAIAANPDLAYDYTARRNRVGVISNGTAILGLGDLGALASKPVMEGKAVLFKRFADIDAIDLEVDTSDVDEFIGAVRYLTPTFGGINLEDIKAPDCFIIEQRLRELMDIPVFHDDQHGTAIITLAGLINSLHLTGRNIKDIKVVANGAGAAGIACLDLFVAMGVPRGNIVLCDTKGVIFRGRTEGMNQWKAAFASETKARSLSDALEGADVFLGLSAKGAVTQAMMERMAKKPIIFAMANPDPEITPEEVREVRPDAIVATGRSDYPNQINNVLGFPYIFRGALDVAARTINEEMKIAAAHALAELAREDVPDEVAVAYRGARPSYGPDYIIPVPFDPRLISRVSSAVAEAAIKSGVARRPIKDMAAYRDQLSARLDPAASLFQTVTTSVRANPKRVVFAEGEEEAAMRAAGDADGMVTGVTPDYTVALNHIRQVLDPRPGQLAIGVTVILSKGRLIFVADTTVHEMPTAEELADITVQMAGAVRRFGHEPRVALLAFSTFGYPRGERSERIVEAVELLAKRKVDFEYDGEMAADVALDRERMRLYPFCRLSDVANVLIMPAIHSASISTKLLQQLGEVTMLGPLLVGLDKSVQIAPLGAKMSEIYNMAVLAAYDINR